MQHLSFPSRFRFSLLSPGKNEADGPGVLKSRRVLSILFPAVALFLIVSGRYLIVPDVASLKHHNPEKTAFMNYREHQWKKSGSSRQAFTKWVSLERISPHLVRAVVVSEDAKFWNHHGFDFAEMKNAARVNLEKKRLKFGASTITQQLVKNLYLKPSKNFMRKSAEAVLTWRMERALSKKRILEIYLNVIEWGDGLFGIERAAQHYYGKSAAELDAAEAAHLAVVLPNPIRYNPLSDGRYISRRSDTIYRRMNPGRDTVKQGAIDSQTVIVDSAAALPDAITMEAAPETVSDTAVVWVPDDGALQDSIPSQPSDTFQP